MSSSSASSPTYLSALLSTSPSSCDDSAISPAAVVVAAAAIVVKASSPIKMNSFISNQQLPCEEEKEDNDNTMMFHDGDARSYEKRHREYMYHYVDGKHKPRARTWIRPAGKKYLGNHCKGMALRFGGCNMFSRTNKIFEPRHEAQRASRILTF